MHPHIIAGLLERALHTSIAAEACLAARGSTTLQNDLTRRTRQALADHGADPHHPTDRQLLTCAATLRRSTPASAADPAAIAAVLTAAAHRITTHLYGPAHGQLEGDIVDTIERLTPDDPQLRFDVLTTITQHLPQPGMTITAWEWNANPAGAPGAAALLRNLAARRPVPAYIPLPTEPACDTTTVDLRDTTPHDLADQAGGPQRRADLRDLEPLAAQWAARRDGRPLPPLDPASRQALIRTLTEAAARGAAINPEAARLAQERADQLRAGLD
ncbi:MULTISPECIES: hypothetical protein [unclassified Kitasatospora]|uniref:hypothetical protein n=1 Tax=unclassified Kitasatospora TaxID=2633591 RepID=UPI0033D2C059